MPVEHLLHNMNSSGTSLTVGQEEREGRKQETRVGYACTPLPCHIYRYMCCQANTHLYILCLTVPLESEPCSTVWLHLAIASLWSEGEGRKEAGREERKR